MRIQQGLYVPNGKNRFEEELMIWGTIPLQIKISTDDTDGALFVFGPEGWTSPATCTRTPRARPP